LPVPAFDPKDETDSPRLIHGAPDYALACWRDVFVVIWRRETTLKAVHHLRRECEGFSRIQGRKKERRGINKRRRAQVRGF
jgi:hypothetical protein